MFSIMHNIKNLCENLGSISHWSYKKIVKEKTALLQLMCVLLLTWLASEAWSPVHTSCECECEANLDVTNSQRTIRSSCPEFNSLANIAAKLGCDVKFTSNSLRIRIHRKYEPGLKPFSDFWGTQFSQLLVPKKIYANIFWLIIVSIQNKLMKSQVFFSSTQIYIFIKLLSRRQQILSKFNCQGNEWRTTSNKWNFMSYWQVTWSFSAIFVCAYM